MVTAKWVPFLLAGLAVMVPVAPVNVLVPGDRAVRVRAVVAEGQRLAEQAAVFGVGNARRCGRHPVWVAYSSSYLMGLPALVTSVSCSARVVLV
jgi:hypothetical protein